MWLCAALRRAHPRLIVVESLANSGVLSSMISTAAGVAVGGEKLAAEIEELVRTHAGVRRISLIGHSLGGLYCRAAAPRIRHLRLEPVNFITFATPHAGVRGHSPWLVELAVRAGAIGTTGYHLLMADGDAADGNTPLLLRMSRLGSDFMESLAAFPNRVLVGSVDYDLQIPHWSSGLLPGGAAGCAGAAAEMGLQRWFEKQASAMTAEPSNALARVPSWFARRAQPKRGHGGTGEAPEGEETTHVDMSPYPHVVGMYHQPRLDAPNATRDAATGGREPEAAPGGAGAIAHGGVADEPARRDAVVAAAMAAYEPERAAIEQLRQLRGWTNVDVRFDEWPSALNHIRIAVVKPAITQLGADVVDFVVNHCFWEE